MTKIAEKRIALVVPTLGEDEIRAVELVLRSGHLAQGPQVRAFEEEFAEVVGTKYAVAFNSGTAAIHGALAAIGVGPGDTVATTPFTFAATATPVLMLGAKPVFCDIDGRHFNVDARDLTDVPVKAAVGVDLFGLPFDTNGNSRVPVVEDACQAIGSTRDGKSAGARTAVGAFSFYATKNIMTGEGGMLTTDSEEIAEAARRFRHHGQSQRYEYESLGYNYRMTDMQAAIGRVQLQKLSGLTERRIGRAARYDAGLIGLKGVTTPHVPAGVKHCYHQYSILVDGALTASRRDRDAVKQFLSESGIDTGIYYPKPLHLHKLFAPYVRENQAFPVAERVSKQILALPMHDDLGLEDQHRVIEMIRASVEQ